MLNWLYTTIATVLDFWHEVWSGVFAPDSGAAWGLAIAFLTITVRVLLFPLFVKQIRSQRALQVLQPQVKELQAKYKDDKQQLQTELMKLYRENNANPLSGCFPILLQMPVFLALFTVINRFNPNRSKDLYGIDVDKVHQGAEAQIFGAPIAAKFTSSAEQLAEFGASAGPVRLVTIVMIVLMGASTYWTQRQLMAKTNVTDPQQLMIQRVMLYVLPLSFAVFGVNFPIGVLTYWLTTNLWSMGQQAYVIKRMPTPDQLAQEQREARAATSRTSTPAPGARPTRPAVRPATRTEAPVPAPAGGSAAPASSPSSGAGSAPAGPRRPAGGNRGKRKRRGGRR